MVLKIYIATVIVTLIADMISALRVRELCKRYGLKCRQRTVAEILRGVLASLILYALPGVNVLMSLIALTISDELVVEILKYGRRVYKVSDNE